MALDAKWTTYVYENGKLIVCDPIHGTYQVKKPYIDIVQTAEMQRLKEITQTGFSFYDYPSLACEDRLAHSLGAFHIMEKILNKLTRLLSSTDVKISKEDREIALCAILLHDIGHGPFSHCFESISNYSHEKRTTDILLGDTEVNKVLVKQFGIVCTKRIASFIAEIDESDGKDDKFESTSFSRLIKSLISHQIDADRLDYLVRDAYYAGIETSINVDKIINSISLVMNAQGEYEVIMDKRNLTLIETPLIERFQHYRDIYFTPGSVIGDKLFKNTINLLKANDSSLIDKVLPEEFLELVNSPENLKLSSFLKLTDQTVKDSLNIIKKNTDNMLLKKVASGDSAIKSFVLYEDIFVKDRIIDMLSKLISRDKSEIKSEYSIYEIYYKTKFYKKDEGFKIRAHQNIVDLTDVTNLVNARDYVEMKCTAFSPDIFYLENNLSKVFKSKKEFLSLVTGHLNEIQVKEEEFELKYLASGQNASADARFLLNLLLDNGFTCIKNSSFKNSDKYYDTNNLDLFKAGKILRIRSKGDSYIGTYKAPLSDGSIYTSRVEIEEKIGENEDISDLLEKVKKRGIAFDYEEIPIKKLEVSNLRDEFILSKNGAKVSFCIDHVNYIYQKEEYYALSEREVMIEVEAFNDMQDRFLLTEIHSIIMGNALQMGLEIEITNKSKYQRAMEKFLC